MEPTSPWSRHRRHHHYVPRAGDEPGARGHHPHEHPGGFEGPFGRAGGPFGHHGGPFGPGHPGGRGGGHRGRPGGRPGRAGRGDVRTALLLLLAEEPMHGYQLMQAVAERTGGAWKLSPGAVYPTIAQLEDEGLVRVTAEGGRKLVALTEAGRAHVAGLGDVDPFTAFGGAGDRPDLRALMGELMGAAHQLGRVGDADQLAQAARVIGDARRALYLILAGQAPDGGSDGPPDTPQ
ncbi:PadR family transcriptional regulator [Modestobacter marinus]|uniref:PadR family transcriptional regulator n=1 Tax=Modestobacter marinus TaxID=477641 RepID=UPI001C95883B|nr:PadR family transcriptional regulator [Modestobacter marinus]